MIWKKFLNMRFLDTNFINDGKYEWVATVGSFGFGEKHFYINIIV